MKKSIKVAVVSALAALSIAAVVSAADYQAQQGTASVQTGAPQGQPPMGGPRGRDMMKSRLDQAVQSGQITSDQRTKLEAAMTKHRAERDKEFQQKQNERITTLSSKTGVSADTLKEIFARPERPQPGQAAPNGMNQGNGNGQINAAGTMPAAPQGQPPMGKDQNRKHNFMEERLTKAVQDGKITEAQKTSIQQELQSERQAWKAKEQAKDGSSDQSQKAERQKKFQEKRDKDMQALSQETGISTDTLKQLFARPQHVQGKPGNETQPIVQPTAQQ